MKKHFIHRHPTASLTEYKNLWSIDDREAKLMEGEWADRHKVVRLQKKKNNKMGLVISDAHSSSALNRIHEQNVHLIEDEGDPLKLGDESNESTGDTSDSEEEKLLAGDEIDNDSPRIETDDQDFDDFDGEDKDGAISDENRVPAAEEQPEVARLKQTSTHQSTNAATHTLHPSPINIAPNLNPVNSSSTSGPSIRCSG
ncbi:hypothetical protein V5O48_012442 [Marasmius crinis-equi]|uniref:Uncharacterized protein n=1 Tax=Marasmius crinis-equi TaxID=585013 RepID=A0ABR3F335_9AGAR